MLWGEKDTKVGIMENQDGVKLKQPQDEQITYKEELIHLPTYSSPIINKP